MATRSRIGLFVGDESILSVYHHWDGYPEWLGVHLVHNYSTKQQIAELLDGGDISCIESDQDWDRKECEPHVLYYNDRGEKTEPRLDLNEDEFFANGEEYAYIFDPYESAWECYDLHGTSPKRVNIPSEHPKELNVS